jgi:phosphatidylinositol alpha-mannosyltransferase
MKVGFVVDDSMDSTDGVQQYVLTLSTWLKKKGVDVHYLTAKTHRTDLEQLYSLSGKIPVRFNKNKMSIPLPASPKKIAKLLSTQKFDVLHVQMPFSPVLAARVVDLAPKNTVIIGTFHIAPFSRIQNSASKILGYYVKPTLRRFDQVFSVSSAAKDMALGTFKLKSTIMPNVIDVSGIKRSEFTDNRNSIVFLGRLVPRKGCAHLIRAFASYLENHPDSDYHLEILGDGAQRAKLEKLVDKCGIRKQVTFRGRVSEGDKYKYLSNARLAIFPSISGESFGIVLLEAMAAGAGVVLGGDNDGYREVLDNDRRYLFEPGNVEHLQKLIEKYDDHNEIRSANTKQQSMVAKYSVDTVGPKILGEYKRLIAKKTGSIDNKTK